MKSPNITLPGVAALALTLLCSGCVTTRPEAGTGQVSGDLPISLRTDKKEYKAGETVKITVTASEPCWVRVFNFDTQGKSTQIWPNQHSNDRPLAAGQALVLPDSSRWALKAKAPAGRSKLVATAYKDAHPVLSAAEFAQGSAPSDPSLTAGKAVWFYQVTE